MTDAPTDADDDGDVEDPKLVERDRDKLRKLIGGLSRDDINSGGWFTALIAHALNSYTEKVTWEYFQERYEGMPPDGIVDQRIKMAARYAALEGGVSAGAYTMAIVATLGSRSGPAKATVPAALATVVFDLAFITQLQLRLAYDIAVLYRVPLDPSDPTDLWKLIRVALTIKSGEIVRESVIKAVPVVMRRVIKHYYSGAVLNTAKALPVVGKYLLQRNIVKIGIPIVGVPVAVLLNRYTTLVAGRHAQSVFRNEARVIALAEDLTDRTQHPQLLLWVSWLVIMADGKIADDEALLFSHLARLVRDRHAIVDEQLSRVIEVDPAVVWRRVEAESGDLSDILDAANRVAAVDGVLNAEEQSVLAELQDRCNRH